MRLGSIATVSSAAMAVLLTLEAAGPDDALAQTPADVLSDLRQEANEGPAAWASDAEFRDALDRLPGLNARPQPSEPAVRPARFPASASDDPRPTTARWPGGRGLAPDNRMLLFEKAFELERIAHELEIAELYAPADKVRAAAAALRSVARPSGPDAARRGDRDGRRKRRDGRRSRGVVPEGAPSDAPGRF